MSLVAARFHSWTKPLAFRTVRIHRSNNWTQRINNWLLPNADFIRTLVLDLPLTQDGYRSEVPAEELAILRALLEAAGGVRHLAVTWNIWAYLQSECSALQLRRLYLIWDGAYKISAPSLKSLQYPDALVDLTFCAPTGLEYEELWYPLGEYLLPAIGHCANLAYATYAANSIPDGFVSLGVKGAMIVLLGRTEPYEHDTSYMKYRAYPHCSVVCVQNRYQVLEEWVAKMEGRESLLDHTVDIVSVDKE
ncbi:hypothetical protein B0H15DRAFT_796626 [Mycena belliarum]|uniref:Uncharacterized protein n=1 Tax=Mycena belliarum TaxID=1033014 RepID=A0AAD6XUT0_9AGAR|nr:hypothetical protein B0H15DRAFT_796626 [Mycena belliae]